MGSISLRKLYSRALKTILVVGVAPLALLIALKISIAGALGDSMPQLALAWSPFDANAKANWAALALSDSRDPSAVSLGRTFARDALGRDATRVVALRALGLAADASGNLQEAVRLMNESDRLSRRDQLTQVWLVGYGIRRGDTAGIIRHLDAALRTSDQSKQLLYSALISASEDPEIAAALAAKLREKPDWWLGFTAELVVRGRQLAGVVAITRGLLSPRVPEERIVIESLLQRLANAQQYDLAWRVYQDASPSQPSAAASVTLRNGGIEALDGFAPFDWLVSQEPDLRAERMARPDSRPGNALFLTAANGRTGQVASQLMRLDPGSYRFNVEAGAVPADPFERPNFRIDCAGAEARVLMDLRPGAASAGTARLGGSFAVPGDCRWQWLRINIASGDTAGDATPWIDNVSVARAAP